MKAAALTKQTPPAARPARALSVVNPLDAIPKLDVGDLPGVNGECEAMLNLSVWIGGVFLGLVRPA